MPAGSLIFVIIVAIWAAYLLQHWVRRQENTAAARSVERFSKAMRVLERRPALADVQTPVVPSHHSSARIVRPVVDVKRAVPAGDLRRSPLVARSSTVAVLDSNEVDLMPGQPSASAHRPAQRVSPLQRRLRAGVLLTALAWVPTSVVLVVLGTLLWISIPFSLLTVIAVVVWLRTEATADRARRGWPGHDEQHVLSSDDTQVIRAEAVAQAAMQALTDAAHVGPAAQASHATHTSHTSQAPAHRAHVARAEVFDGEAARSQPVPTARPEPADGTWSPVPVPPPTYSMKAKVEPRMTANGIPADVFDTPEFAEEAEELDERALFVRRAVSE